MKSEIKYIELKSGYSDDGPAWIGFVQFSKTRQTVYFNGKAFKGNGHGYCFDVETKETYWITGIKKNTQNRHWAGRGKIMIDRLVADDFLKMIDCPKLDLKKYELVDILKTDKQRFAAIENSLLYQPNDLINYPNLNEMTIDELKELVQQLKWKENRTNPNNGVKYVTVKLLEAETLLDRLIN